MSKFVHSTRETRKERKGSEKREKENSTRNKFLVTALISCARKKRFLR